MQHWIEVGTQRYISGGVAAILARTLGIHTDVAVTWQRHSAGDWATYAADVSRRNSTERTGDDRTRQ